MLLEGVHGGVGRFTSFQPVLSTELVVGGVTVILSSQARARMRWASVMISGPMPSPGITARSMLSCFSHASTVIRAADGR